RGAQGAASKPSSKITSLAMIASGTRVATSNAAGAPACATRSADAPSTGGAATVIENEYSVPQSRLAPSGAVQVTRSPLVSRVQASALSKVPLLNLDATISWLDGSGMLKLSKPRLLTTRGLGPLPAPCACSTARAKSKFITA